MITDKNLAKWAGVTTQTLRNWKRPQVLEGGMKFYPPEGKHNIYKSLRLGYYLLNYTTYEEDGQEFSEHNNKLEELSGLTDSLVSLMEVIKNNNLPEEVRGAAFVQLEDTAITLKNECDKLFSLI